MKQLPTILIVDDINDNLILLETIIRNLDVNLIKALSGYEALEITKGIVLALAIIDVRMPVMNGYEVTAVIRDPASAVRRHDIPVIALTGNAMKQDVDVCIAAGMDDHLPKPLLFPDLLAMLEKWLKGNVEYNSLSSNCNRR